MPPKYVLHLEDDKHFYLDVAAQLRRVASVVSIHAADDKAALRLALGEHSDETRSLGLADEPKDRFAAIIVDLAFDAATEAIRGGTRPMVPSGQVVAEQIRASDPSTPILAFTAWADEFPSCRVWFERHSLDVAGCLGWYNKRKKHDQHTLARRVAAFTQGMRLKDRVEWFVIHGHDHATRQELMQELSAQAPVEPVYLDVNLHPGRTIIEQFEAHAERAVGAFALLTEDDWARPINETSARQAQARQNVILEIGYCLGLYGRGSGRTILLTKGEVKLPSDLDGLSKVSLDGGVAAAVKALLPAIERYC
jgi:predicted nucleotide-binding protein